MNKLIEEHGSRTKLKFLHGKLQVMEELPLDYPLFNEDWIAEVNIAEDECSSEVTSIFCQE